MRGRGGVDASADEGARVYIYVCVYMVAEKAKGESAGRWNGRGGRSVTVIFGMWVTHKPRLVP